MVVVLTPFIRHDPFVFHRENMGCPYRGLKIKCDDRIEQCKKVEMVKDICVRERGNKQMVQTFSYR